MVSAFALYSLLVIMQIDKLCSIATINSGRSNFWGCKINTVLPSVEFVLSVYSSILYTVITSAVYSTSILHNKYSTSILHNDYG